MKILVVVRRPNQAFMSKKMLARMCVHLCDFCCKNIYEIPYGCVVCLSVRAITRTTQIMWCYVSKLDVLVFMKYNAHVYQDVAWSCLGNPNRTYFFPTHVRAYHQNCLVPSMKADAFPSEEEDWFCWQCECLLDCLEMLEHECQVLHMPSAFDNNIGHVRDVFY